MAVLPARAATGPEQRRVGIVEEHGQLGAGAGARRQLGVPQVVGRDHVVGEGHRPPFQPGQHAERGRAGVASELVGVELGAEVVDVEDQAGAEQLGDGGGEDLEVGQRVHVDDVVALAQVLARDDGERADEEGQHPEQVAVLRTLVLAPALDAQDLDARHGLPARLARPEQGDRVHARAGTGERLRVADDAPVRLVEGVGEHAHAQASGRRWRGRRGDGQVVGHVAGSRKGVGCGSRRVLAGRRLKTI